MEVYRLGVSLIGCDQLVHWLIGLLASIGLTVPDS